MLPTQFNIIDLSINYLHSILKSKHLNKTELKEYCRKSRTLFQSNLNRAARIRLDSLHAVIYPWYTKLLNEIERETLKVIITGPQSLRKGYLVTQYFEALFHLDDEQHHSNRILYAEHRDLMMDEAIV